MQTLFVTVQNDKSTLIKLYEASSDGRSYTETPSVAPISIQHNSQPFFFDINGDRK